jgi:hypothetical protein
MLKYINNYTKCLSEKVLSFSSTKMIAYPKGKSPLCSPFYLNTFIFKGQIEYP